MRVLFIGDIVGSPGREIVRDRLADLVSQKRVDLVIANGENSASGFGITPKIVEELLKCGVEVISGGNHSWDRREIMEFMPYEPRHPYHLRYQTEWQVPSEICGKSNRACCG